MNQMKKSIINGTLKTMGIDELRAMYGVFDYAYQTWPGAPKRPLEEQEYLRYMKNKLFAMILEYNLDN